MMDPTPRPSKVVETGIYVKDLERAQHFYGDVLSLELHSKEVGRHAFFKAGKSMLLLFNADTTLKEKQTPHGGSGSQHFVLQVDESDLDAWRVRLREKGVAIESEVDWPKGGHSIYFRDPDQNLVELITPGLWPVNGLRTALSPGYFSTAEILSERARRKHARAGGGLGRAGSALARVSLADSKKWCQKKGCLLRTESRTDVRVKNKLRCGLSTKNGKF